MNLWATLGSRWFWEGHPLQPGQTRRRWWLECCWPHTVGQQVLPWREFWAVHLCVHYNKKSEPALSSSKDPGKLAMLLAGFLHFVISLSLGISWCIITLWPPFLLLHSFRAQCHQHGTMDCLIFLVIWLNSVFDKESYSPHTGLAVLAVTDNSWYFQHHNSYLVLLLI